MLNRMMDILFTDSFAFAINFTLGKLIGSKLCNYSWDRESENNDQDNLPLEEFE